VTKASFLVTHPDGLPVALSAARTAKLSTDRIILFDDKSLKPMQGTHPTVQDLINQGSALPPFRDRKLSPGEGKTKIAFFKFSSGTTGRPKASHTWRELGLR